VEGGVAVGKPGAVADPVAAELIAAAVLECEPQILPRGRTYARAGQVMAVAIAEGEITGQIQGTGAHPYQVRLFRTRISGAERLGAACTCPYGCDDGWCKHAAALAYVGAAVLDRDAGLRGQWTGEAPPSGAQGPVDGVVPASSLVVDADALAVLRSPPPVRDPAQVLTWAAGIVPLP
jgi:hypothetical protein